jgi:hypothetical protein
MQPHMSSRWFLTCRFVSLLAIKFFFFGIHNMKFHSYFMYVWYIYNSVALQKGNKMIEEMDIYWHKPKFVTPLNT